MMMGDGCGLDERNFFHKVSLCIYDQRIREVGLDFANFRVNTVTQAVVDSECGIDQGCIDRNKIFNKIPVFDPVFQNSERQKVLIPKLIDSKLERIKNSILCLLIFGYEFNALVKSQPNIKPSLSFISRVHRYIVNLIIHPIAITLIAITQVHFQILHKQSRMRPSHNNLEPTCMRMFLTVTHKSIHHFITASKSTVNVIS